MELGEYNEIVDKIKNEMPKQWQEALYQDLKDLIEGGD